MIVCIVHTCATEVPVGAAGVVVVEVERVEVGTVEVGPGPGTVVVPVRPKNLKATYLQVSKAPPPRKKICLDQYIRTLVCQYHQVMSLASFTSCLDLAGAIYCPHP